MDESGRALEDAAVEMGLRCPLNCGNLDAKRDSTHGPIPRLS
jgi:hypothetical protein